MLNKKSYKTAAATIIIAATAGFVMQNGDALAARFAMADSPQPQAQPDPSVQLVAAEIVDDSASIPPAITQIPADTSGLADRVNRAEQNYVSPNLAADQPLSPLGLACDVALTATKAAGAMVTLDFKAPCHANETVAVNHEGLTFTAVTSDVGHFTTVVPAMAMVASFELELLDGETISATANVPEISGYDRVAVQWVGDSGLRIHALEMGADYGENGHVWAEAPQSVAKALQARGGYITELGKIDFPAAKHAEIYSFPTGQIHKSGVVRLSVEAEVTASTCDKEITAQALQSGVDGGVSIVDLTLSMPACDAIGDFLVLNNLLRDLKIAQNQY